METELNPSRFHHCSESVSLRIVPILDAGPRRIAMLGRVREEHHAGFVGDQLEKVTFLFELGRVGLRWNRIRGRS